MKTKTTPFEWLGSYVFLLFLLNLFHMVDNGRMAASFSFLVLFGMLGIGAYIKNGPLPSRIKSYLKQHRIRWIHLWIGIIVAYYGIVGIVELIS